MSPAEFLRECANVGVTFGSIPVARNLCRDGWDHDLWLAYVHNHETQEMVTFEYLCGLGFGGRQPDEDEVLLTVAMDCRSVVTDFGPGRVGFVNYFAWCEDLGVAPSEQMWESYSLELRTANGVRRVLGPALWGMLADVREDDF